MAVERRKKISARKLVVLLLLAAPGRTGVQRTPISGATRMQKLVFLVSDASRDFLRDDEVFDFDISYSPDRFGPADLDLYQDLELLKAAGLITINGQTGVTQATGVSLIDEPHEEGQPLLPEDQEETELSFEYLMGEQTEELDLAQAERQFEPEYRITEAGLSRLEMIQTSTGKRDQFDRLDSICRKIKRDFNDVPLHVLLRHVYTEHQDMTIKSEIKDRVLN